MSRVAHVVRTRWRLLAATLAATVLATVGLAIGAGPASAHNVLKSSSPEDQESVARTPSSVVLTFDEPAIALGTKLVVTGPTGPVQVGTPRLVDNTVTQDLQSGAPAGAYTVEWRVTSSDGHPISGSFSFTAKAAGDASPAPSVTPVPSVTPAPSTAPALSGSSGVWLVTAAVLLVAAGLTALVRRRRTHKDRSVS
jgi:methionine-rich copper-binding protein CopC